MFDTVKSIGARNTVLGYWCLNETSGTTINDYSGNGHTGTYAGSSVSYNQTALVADGSGNGSVQYTATSQSKTSLGTIPHTSTIAPASFTAVVWFKYSGPANTSLTQNVVMLSMDDNNTGGWEVAFNTATTNSSYLVLTTSNACTNWASVFNGNPHLIAVGVTGTRAYCSMDAAIYATTTGVTYTQPSTRLTIANTSWAVNNNKSIQGYYQHLAIFSGQLSQGQLTRLYNCGHSGQCG